MLKVAINGIMGRMGQELVSALDQSKEFDLIGGIDPSPQKKLRGIKVTQEPAELLPQADVLIDFSLPQGAMQILNACLMERKALVTGTTGLNEEQLSTFEQAAQSIPIVQAFNFSIGITLMIKLVGMAAKTLKNKADVEIVEKHHRMKKDSPSGTAILLAKEIVAKMELTEKEIFKFGRRGKNLSRGSEIGMHSLRGGSVIGEHIAFFFGENENLSIGHQALNRKIFVDGALLAAKWIVGKNKGLYSMLDVLEF